MLRVLPFVVVLGLIAATTIQQGIDSDRWEVDHSEKLQQFAARLENVPTTIGQWESMGDDELDPEEWKRTNCLGYISRQYRNPDGEVVSMFLVAGSGRHATIHTPDQCYPGAGYEMESRPQPIDVALDGSDSSAEFAYAAFQREDSSQRENLLVLWTYSDNGQWEGPITWKAKSEFGTRPALFKVYLVTQIKEGEGRTPLQSASAKFARDLMPALNAALFPPEQASGSEDQDAS